MSRRGIAYMAGSAACFSVMSALVKLAGERLPAAQIVSVRAAVTLALSWVMVRRAGLSPWGNHRAKLALRGLLGFAALSCYYWTLTRLPLAEATVIHHLAPVFTALGAWAVLGERAGAPAVAALGLGLAGVALVARPDLASGAGLEPAALAVALLGAACSGSAYVAVRSLSRHEDPLVIVLFFPLVALPLSLPWAAAAWVAPTAAEWLALLGVGVSTQAAQVCLTRGLALERAGRATAVGYLQVALAVGWGALWFGEWPAPSTLAGAALIVAGTALIAATAGGTARRG